MENMVVKIIQIILSPILALVVGVFFLAVLIFVQMRWKIW